MIFPSSSPSPSFQDWPRQHRLLLYLTAATLLLSGLAYYFLLRPRFAILAEAREELHHTEKKLKDSPWPRDAERLERTLKSYEAAIGTRKNPGLLQLSENSLQECTSLFSERIADNYENDDNFLSKSSQIEYRDQFDRLVSNLRNRNVFLDGEVFGLNVSTSEPKKYQMMLKLWATELAVDQILKHNLAIVHLPGSDNRTNQMSAQLTALPVKSYILETGDSAPFLLEIPIRITVAGTMQDFLAFGQSLQTPQLFFPMTQMEITLLPPPPPDQGHQFILAQTIHATIVCSAFYRPSSARLPSGNDASSKPPLPPGA